MTLMTRTHISTWNEVNYIVYFLSQPIASFKFSILVCEIRCDKPKFKSEVVTKRKDNKNGMSKKDRCDRRNDKY